MENTGDQKIYDYFIYLKGTDTTMFYAESLSEVAKILDIDQSAVSLAIKRGSVVKRKYNIVRVLKEGFQDVT